MPTLAIVSSFEISSKLNLNPRVNVISSFVPASIIIEATYCDMLPPVALFGPKLASL